LLNLSEAKLQNCSAVRNEIWLVGKHSPQAAVTLLNDSQVSTEEFVRLKNAITFSNGKSLFHKRINVSNRSALGRNFTVLGYRTLKFLRSLGQISSKSYERRLHSIE
jgi:hypothetical protein